MEQRPGKERMVPGPCGVRLDFISAPGTGSILVTQAQGQRKKVFHHPDFSNSLADFWGSRIVSKRSQNSLDVLDSHQYLHLFRLSSAVFGCIILRVPPHPSLPRNPSSDADQLGQSPEVDSTVS